jgi:anti-sigma regulatory factor (Ser/Thr protein kinase)/anti-anti-sigma regulatory factor
VIVELQEALLPTALPVLPGADVAARYLVAARDQAAGGDWFDAVPLADGTVALLVGDIVGHGVKASAAMGQLRAVLDELLVRTGDIDEALRWADSMASRTPQMRAATVCAAVLDPASGTLRYATCGHPPPLVIATDGRARYLAQAGSGPLGTGSPPAMRSETLRTDEVLLLYSDGLVEQPGEPIETGMATLARAAGDAVANRAFPVGAPKSAAERACHDSVELLTRTGYDDDVTTLAVQRRTRPAEVLHREAVADPMAVISLWGELSAWLLSFGPAEADERSVQLAVTELVANVIEHAYDGQLGPVRLRAELGTGGVLDVEVADDGTWREPAGPAETSGRGLWLGGAVIDELRVAHSDGVPPGGPPGTVASLRHRLSRPALLGTGTTGPPREGDTVDFAVSIDEGRSRVLRVSGPVDITTADRFTESFDNASRGGVHPLDVDLTDVEILASAGVRAVFAARDQLAVHDHRLTIIAAAGSPADQVLALVGLDHRRARASESR